MGSHVFGRTLTIAMSLVVLVAPSSYAATADGAQTSAGQSKALGTPERGAPDPAEPTVTAAPSVSATPPASATPDGIVGTATPPDTTLPDETAPPPEPSATSDPTGPTEVEVAESSGGWQTVALSARPGGFGSLPAMPSMPGSPSGALRATQPIVFTDEIEVDPFELAGVTWLGEGELRAWVRTRSDGTWSQWYELPSADDHAPDPGTAEAARERRGTDPLVVAPSDAIQVRADAADPQALSDVRLDLVEPGADPPPSVMNSEVSLDAEPDADADPASPGSAVRPTIMSRAAWGADESLRVEPPKYVQVHGAFVHHTVNANSYTAAEVPGIIRGIYVYHVRSRGWNDIGYNFLVDRFGRVWEGRYGGISRAVQGAHTSGYNDDAFAMSAIGTYQDAQPSSAMISAYQRLFAWKFAIHGVDPRYPVDYDGESWPAIAGHRDAASTACPGAELYARLSTIRRGTIVALGLSPSRDLDKDGIPDLAGTKPDGTLWLMSGLASGGYAPPRALGAGWNAMTPVMIPGDWDGGRHDDLIAKRRTDGTLWLFSGQGRVPFASSRQIGAGWNTMNAIIAPGDWNGDGNPDLMARQASDGSLWLYRGTGTGGFGVRSKIGSGWAAMDAVVGAGDWNGDRLIDLIARRSSDGTLWLYPGAGGNAFGTAQRIGTGWRGYLIVGAGDVNRDGRPDLVARTPAGQLMLYPGNGAGGIGAPSTLSTGWSGFNRLF
ncbi:MAG TPA: FG-GAP-like repeat-containing protein [Jiangellaceae bacterium]